MIYAKHGHRSRRLMVGLIALLAVLGSIAVPVSAQAAGESLHSLLNSDRAANGLGPLQRNGSMDAVALAWANQMAASGTLSHNPSYSSQIPGGWSRAAENVASGYASEGATHAGWMASAGHRANILGDFTSVGIAFISVGGKTWAVEVFGKYGASAPPAAGSGSGSGTRSGASRAVRSAPVYVPPPIVYTKITTALAAAPALPEAPGDELETVVLVDTPSSTDPVMKQLRPAAVLPLAIPLALSIVLLAGAGILVPGGRLRRAHALVADHS